LVTAVFFIDDLKTASIASFSGVRGCKPTMQIFCYVTFKGGNNENSQGENYENRTKRVHTIFAIYFVRPTDIRRNDGTLNSFRAGGDFSKGW